MCGGENLFIILFMQSRKLSFFSLSRIRSGKGKKFGENSMKIGQEVTTQNTA